MSGSSGSGFRVLQSIVYGLCGWVAVAGAARGGNADAAKEWREIALAAPATRAFTFQTENPGPLLIWVRCRLDRGQGEGAGRHALRLWLDGRALGPDAVQVLNKREVVDAGQPERGAISLYDAGADAWFVKADSDYTAFNSGVQGDPYNLPEWTVCAGRAYFRSHYYEYLFRVSDVAQGKHALGLEALAPAGGEAEALHIAALTVRQPVRPLLLSALDWMEEVFPWQAPCPGALLDAPLRVSGCAGEYEPVTFSVFALENLPRVTARIDGPLHAVDGQGTGPADLVTEVFAVRTLRREALGEASFIARLPFVPEPWELHSPELLIPAGEEPADLPRFQTQRFYVDLKIPRNAPPGVYRGELALESDGRRIAGIPLECEVLPFALVAAPSTYWMWRLTWSPISEPSNVACVHDIAAHGYTGLARACGAGFKVSIDEQGEIRVDASSMAALAGVLRDAGLAPRVTDTGLAGNVLGAVAAHLDLRFADLPAEMPDLEAYFRQRMSTKADVETARGILAAREPGILTDDDPLDSGGVDALAGDLLGQKTEEQIEAEIAERAAKRAAEVQARVDELAPMVFRKVQEACDRIGLQVDVFPVDEPCGTPWKRRWTAYAARLARMGGMTTWSTLNNFAWESYIDQGAAGGMINAMYREPELSEGPFRGELRIPALPLIGAFRDGEAYHFAGELDEVRIYDRALSVDEILSQHETPAAEGVIAYYAFDEAGERPAVIGDASGQGNDAELIGSPRLVEGRKGRAIALNGIDEHLAPRAAREYDLSKGWSISLWARGSGCLFGRGYDFYTAGARSVRYTTTEQDKEWFAMGGLTDPRFWSHLALVFDPADHAIRAYVYDREIRDWHRRNVTWNYMQVRSMPPKNPRYKTGVMAWFYANTGALTNITTFCYDWNTNHLYVVYPKGGERFGDNVVWYRTLGWEACREGIDDARYLQTLVEALQRRDRLSRAQAVEEVARFLDPLTVSYGGINKAITEHGGYAALRGKIVARILEALEPEGGDR